MSSLHPPFTFPIPDTPSPRSPLPSVYTLHFFFLRFKTFLFLYTLVSGSLSFQLNSPLLLPFHPFFFPLSKFSVHCPPDSHPSTWVQFKKPFNSCHSTGLAISPAAKAQTGTLLQQATLNVRLVPPIPNRLKVKDSISRRLVQLKAG